MEKCYRPAGNKLESLCCRMDLQLSAGNETAVSAVTILQRIIVAERILNQIQSRTLKKDEIACFSNQQDKRLYYKRDLALPSEVSSGT
jgi:hypothetical protein